MAWRYFLPIIHCTLPHNVPILRVADRERILHIAGLHRNGSACRCFKYNTRIPLFETI